MTETLALKVIEDSIEHGVTPALKANGVRPGPFFDFLSSHPTLMNKYLTYQQTRAELMADEMVEISNDEHIPIDRIKVMLASRQWFAPRVLPKKYGDKLQVDVNHKLDLRGALEEARARAEKVIGSEITDSVITTKEAEITYEPPTETDENLTRWGERVVESLPLESQPVTLDEDDIFS